MIEFVTFYGLKIKFKIIANYTDADLPDGN